MNVETAADHGSRPQCIEIARRRLDAAAAVCHVPVMHPPAALAPGAEAARLP